MYPYYRPYPPVNPDRFISSAEQMESVLEEGKRISNRVQQSASFARSLMTAAQASKHEEVKNMLLTLDLQSDVSVTFTPDSLTVTLKRQHTKLNLTYQW
ncbi:hypothetical protein LCM20_01125 [Halobacillus litoralis]|uniref:hypothetical protein n=1 Tax=Halobacillus litoralis TaxID=45668 RepID=UPI001CD3CBB2|nr:hypothetical protein [Halobacillus litoralis]MCA0969187.1 hypothetical protein [Halobacillus litoralis]